MLKPLMLALVLLPTSALAVPPPTPAQLEAARLQALRDALPDIPPIGRARTGSSYYPVPEEPEDLKDDGEGGSNADTRPPDAGGEPAP